MDDSRTASRRYLHLLIRDDTCPQLIAAMGLVPQADEKAFVRAVLSQWFSSHTNEADIAAAVHALVSLQRKAESANRPLDTSAIGNADSGIDCSQDTYRLDTTAHQAGGTPR